MPLPSRVAVCPATVWVRLFRSAWLAFPLTVWVSAVRSDWLALALTVWDRLFTVLWAALPAMASEWAFIWVSMVSKASLKSSMRMRSLLSQDGRA